MTRLNDILNRIFVFTVGAACLFAGALSIALYFDVGLAQRFVDLLQPKEWNSIPQSPWFLFSVGTIGVLFLLLGALGLMLNLQRNRIRRIDSAATTTAGSISIDVTEIAEAAGDTFMDLPKVIRSRALVKRDHGQKLILITVDSEATASLSQLTEHAQQVEKDLAEAIADDSFQTVFKFHIAPVERR